MENWRNLYIAAVLETNSKNLQEYIQLAEQAIRQQMDPLNGELSSQELIAMQDALHGLRCLRSERERRTESSGSSESSSA
jgi:hypothetical protein